MFVGYVRQFLLEDFSGWFRLHIFLLKELGLILRDPKEQCKKRY